ncbi:MAG: hypothetical protein KDC38_20565, partial [Planctomycetes bacterium]|nr:hypothetical protein [Planctomycetota bacterium]
MLRFLLPSNDEAPARRQRCWTFLLIAVGVGRITFAQDPNHVLSLRDGAGDTGSVVVVPVDYSNLGTDPTWGWSFGVEHDWSELALVDVEPGAALSGITPEFEEIVIWAAGWTTVTMLSFDGSVALP